MLRGSLLMNLFGIVLISMLTVTFQISLLLLINLRRNHIDLASTNINHHLRTSVLMVWSVWKGLYVIVKNQLLCRQS